jgi:hypothetical protein
MAHHLSTPQFHHHDNQDGDEGEKQQKGATEEVEGEKQHQPKRHDGEGDEESEESSSQRLPIPRRCQQVNPNGRADFLVALRASDGKQGKG